MNIIDDIIELHDLVFGKDFDKNMDIKNLSIILSLPTNEIIYIQAKNKVIAYLILSFIKDSNLTYINKLVVHPDYQNQGYGSLLLKNCLNMFNNKFKLNVESNNYKAIHLYHKFGFIKCSKNKNINGRCFFEMIK